MQLNIIQAHWIKQLTAAAKIEAIKFWINAHKTTTVDVTISMLILNKPCNSRIL